MTMCIRRWNDRVDHCLSSLIRPATALTVKTVLISRETFGRVWMFSLHSIEACLLIQESGESNATDNGFSLH
jgi:hypothetical protein